MAAGAVTRLDPSTVAGSIETYRYHAYSQTNAAAAGSPTLDPTASILISSPADGSGTDVEEAIFSDWSGLLLDLMALVMRGLGIPDLFRAGCVCTSWCAAYSAVRRVRIPITDAAPCLLYSRAADAADTATLYSPSGGVGFKVRVPAPTFRSRYVIGSGHGWVVAADEASNLQALNPLTARHGALSRGDLLRRPGTTPIQPRVHPPGTSHAPLLPRPPLSCCPSAGAECVVLLEHRPVSELSYARLGDERWTQIMKNETVPWYGGYTSATYNKNDGMWYILSSDGSIYAFDLSGPSPTAKTIIQKDRFWNYPTSSYIVFAPWGDMLLVSRHTEARTLTTPVQVPVEHAHDVIDPCIESYTYEMQLHKVDINDRKLVEIRSSDLRGHALFLGFNSAIFLSTKDFPSLRPNNAYLTDDNSEMIILNMYVCLSTKDFPSLRPNCAYLMDDNSKMMNLNMYGIWDFETETIECFADVHYVPPWLTWPPLIWITRSHPPSLTNKPQIMLPN
ncbi:hypothetical protein U9M48_002010 [Paspalum notatum var. saurae]|uniref:KIB1-4 beta-propeller domain-containing protein n=1 Tax=Paspalum notatum var. saurae TaxID=547442 RepID=A0AAQ3PJ40_PASNO